VVPGLFAARGNIGVVLACDQILRRMRAAAAAIGGSAGHFLEKNKKRLPRVSEAAV